MLCNTVKKIFSFNTYNIADGAPLVILSLMSGGKKKGIRNMVLFFSLRRVVVEL